MLTPAIWTSMEYELPLPEALRALHACGWTAFEISSEHLEAIEKSSRPDSLIDATRQCMEELGLSMPQAHGLLPANLAEPDLMKRQNHINRLMRHMDICADLQVGVIVIHPATIPTTTRADRERMTALNVEAFRRLGDYAAEMALQIGIENMAARGSGTPDELNDIVTAIDHPAIGITLDTSHAHMLRLNIPAMIREFGSRLIATHLSDNNGSGDQHLIPGGGTVDWFPIIQALREIGYDGLLNLEIGGDRHANEHFRRMKTRYAKQVLDFLLQ